MSRRPRLRRVVRWTVGTLIVLIAAIALAPSIAAPWAAARLSALSGADVRLGWISWNPLAGRIVLHRVALAPKGDAPAVVTIGSLTLDVALRRWLNGERALDALVLRRPWVSLQRTGPGDFNLATILPGLTAARPSSAAEEVGPPVPFRIRRLRIVSGSIEFRDETTVPVLETSLHLDDASARDLVIASGGTATFAFHIESRLEREPVTLDLGYDSGPDSSRLEAKLVAKGVSLARALLYVPLGWQRTAGTLDATLTYERRLEKNVLKRHGLSALLVLRDLALTEPWASEPMLRATHVKVPSLTVDLIAQRTHLGAIEVEGFQALVMRDDEGVHVPLASGSPEAEGSTWQTELDRVALGKGTAVLRSIVPGRRTDLPVPITSGTIRLPGDEVQFGFVGTLAGGRVTLDGMTRDTATTMTFGLKDCTLKEVSQVFGLPASFVSGSLEGRLELTIAAGGPTLQGVLGSTDARTTPSTEHPEEVLAWQRLDLTIAESALEPVRLHISDATATWPYVMFHRRADGWYPLTLAGPAGDTRTDTTDTTAPGDPWLRVDRATVDGGRIEYYDSTLPKAYGIDLMDLKASADGVSMSPLRITRLVLGGALDELSPFDLRGTVATPRADLTLAVDRLLLPPLNSYLGPALGYEVKTGLAKLESTIRLDGTAVEADTDLVLSRFAMRASGPDTVEAKIGTPLSVALGLMKDTRGDIHLELPIRGDVGSNEYRVGNLLREALGNALLGTLRAPLGFLRGMFRKDEGERFDLRPVPFPPGQATLDTEGEARVDELARLLGRQTALRAVLIPEPSRADVDTLPHQGGSAPVAGLAELARARAETVTARLTQTNGIDPARLRTEAWEPGEPRLDVPGVDVQLRID